MLRKCIWKCIKYLRLAITMIPVFVCFIWHSTHRFGMSRSVYQNEFRKYVKLYRSNGINHYRQMRDFFKTKITLFSDRLKDQPQLPTLVVTVKDDLPRIQLLLEHYRRLGISQFIVIDNNSSDGTREYAAKQPDVRVYLVEEAFATRKKEAWIEKVLALTGYDRWYIVVDSDELIDYVGSESHSLPDLILAESKDNKLCLQGYLVDMYSKNALFGDDCNYREIPKVMSFFDKDSYYFKEKRIYGGPRNRVFGLENQLSKQAVFCFQPDMLYESCHKMHLPPADVQTGRSYIIKHYKFLKQDFAPYTERVNRQNYYNNSIEYKTVMKQLADRGAVSFWYENSVFYENSESLTQLPFLNTIKWDDQ